MIHIHRNDVDIDKRRTLREASGRNLTRRPTKAVFNERNSSAIYTFIHISSLNGA